MKAERSARPRTTPFVRSDWVGMYRHDLLCYCRQLTGSRWDAEDLAHDVILKVAESLEGQPLVHANPRGYLFRTARNAWIDELRKRSSLDFDSAMEAVAPEVTDSLEVEDAFRVLLTRLTPLQRAVVLLRDVYSYTTEETAALLGTTVGAVKASLHRARSTLKSRRSSEPGDAVAATGEQAQIVQAYATLFGQYDIEGLVTLALCDVVDPVQTVSELFHRIGNCKPAQRTSDPTNALFMAA